MIDRSRLHDAERDVLMSALNTYILTLRKIIIDYRDTDKAREAKWRLFVAESIYSDIGV